MSDQHTAEVEELLDAMALRERRVAKRATLLTVIPAMLAIALVAITASSVSQSRNELHVVHQQLRMATDSLRLVKTEAESLRNDVRQAGVQLIAVATTASEMERFIESKESFLRSLDEARFLIDIRMRFDSLHADMLRVAEASPGILDVRPQRRWVTVVRSSKSPVDLRTLAPRWVARYGADQVGLYRSQNGYYALALLGDGTFTSAYRLTEALHRDGRAPGAYFASAPDWGANLLH
jgi:hypothetical protein